MTKVARTTGRSLIMLLTASLVAAATATTAAAAPIEPTVPPTESTESAESVPESAPASTEPAAAAAVAPAAVGGQHQVWSHRGSQTANSYWEPSLTQPGNYTAPVDLAGGRAYVRVVVESKPSDKPIDALICFWRHTEAARFKYETCRSMNVPLVSEGVYYADLGTPSSWWKKGGVYDWSIPASVGRIMLRDPITGKLLLSSKCGAACYNGADLGDHIPVVMRSELIFVSRGGTLAPPTEWRATCPRTWSTQCGSNGGGGGGGGTVTVPGTSTTPTVTVRYSSGTLDVSWQPVTNATRYQFKYRVASGRWTWSEPATTRSQVLTGLTNDTPHTVAVRALVGGTWRAYTNVVVTPKA